MKHAVDPEAVGRVVIVLLIGFLFLYMINSMLKFGEGNAQRQTSGIKDIIDRALVHCYALEGGYPTNLEYIQKYGVIFDNEKYIYHYEWYGGNLRPTVIVLER